VFGASLIGVSIDYTFHYLAEQYLADSAWRPRIGLQRILPGITLGLITSVVAYLALTIAPFPGLKQLAVFSAAGLIGAFLTLLLGARWFPVAHGRSRRSLLLRFSAAYVALWGQMSRLRRTSIAVVIFLTALVCISQLEVDDNVSVLQARPENLRLQEESIADILGSIPSNTFVLLRATSDDEVLELEQTVRVGLDEMIATEALYGYLAVSQSVPSRQRQERSIAAYRRLSRDRLPEYLAILGFADDASAAVVSALVAQSRVLTVDEWLSSPVSDNSRSLWLGDVEGSTASIVLLEGLESADRLRSALGAFPGVMVVDQAGDLSRLLGAYRARVTVLLASAYFAIWLLLALRYGIKRSAVLLLPPALAGLFALGAGAAFGLSLNLFNMLALILVLGIGIDFTLFIAEARGTLAGTAFAITLSAITTILSFGLLAASETYAVSAFGFTVLIGIAAAYLLAPMAVHARPSSNHG
jgi:predicted exporter